MSWNEPGGDQRDPWRGRDEKNPPDLDEAIRQLQERIGKLFGGGGQGGNGGGHDERPGASMRLFGYIGLAALAIWGLSGFYIVDEGNRGVETRFGRYIATTQPGLNWHIPAPIESVEIVNVEQQRFIEIGYRTRAAGGAQQVVTPEPKEALMLTNDENIVDVRLAVQYQVKDAKQFLFNVNNPTATLKQVTESAERGAIGKSMMDFVLTEGRSEIVNEIKKQIQEVMDSYEAGIRITSVNLQDAQPPEQVQSAFEDAIKAREDKQRLINEAEAYANEVIPKSRGAAARVLEEAEAYRARTIAQAEGEAGRFSKLFVEYSKAPEITRKRLYIETIESVLSGVDTVMVDVKQGSNLFYLPLDQTGRPPSKLDVGALSGESGDTQNAHTVSTPQPIRLSNRGREISRGRQ